jgi:hypothetical protein
MHNDKRTRKVSSWCQPLCVLCYILHRPSTTFDFVQPALPYIINSHPLSVFRTPNSHFRTQLTSKHFELSHSATEKLSPELNFESTKYTKNRFHWPRGLRPGFAATHLLELWVRIQPGVCISVSCEYCVLSGRGLCDGLVTRPEESY